MDPARRLMSAACITHCIKLPSVGVLYMTNDGEKFILPLARLLTLHPDTDVRAQYDQLCSKIPADQRYGIFSVIHEICILAVTVLYNFRSAVAGAISELCLRISWRSSVKSFAIEWLLVIPLFHFLTKRSELYGKPELDFSIDWDFYNVKFGITKMSEKAEKEKQ